MAEDINWDKIAPDDDVTFALFDVAAEARKILALFRDPDKTITMIHQLDLANALEKLDVAALDQMKFNSGVPSFENHRLLQFKELSFSQRADLIAAAKEDRVEEYFGFSWRKLGKDATLVPHMIYQIV